MPWIKSSQEDTLKEYPNLKDFLPFLDSHNQESPRGSVLIACSFLDEQLKDIIHSFLLKGSDADKILTGFNAPLGTFSARIKMAFSLSLITEKEKIDCEILRKIRNEFAHNHKTTFNDQRIIDLCKGLHHSAKDYGDVTVDAKGQFSSGAIGLILNLINRPHYVEKEKLKSRSWER